MRTVRKRRPAAASQGSRRNDELPPLPRDVVYTDDYDDSRRTIKNLEAEDDWPLSWDTKHYTLTFGWLPPDLKPWCKWFHAWHLVSVSPGTVAGYHGTLRRIARTSGLQFLRDAVGRAPLQWAEFWEQQVAPNVGVDTALFLKAFLHFMAGMALGGWHPGERDFIRSLPYAWPNNTSSVLSGDALLTPREEQSILGYLDDFAVEVASGRFVSDIALMRASIVVIHYEHGLRPVQSGRIDREDIRCYAGLDGEPIVHFAFRRAKKRKGTERAFEWRRIGRVWAPILSEYHRRRTAGLSGDCRCIDEAAGKLFPISIEDIGQIICDTTERILSVRRTAYDLRHSAAQRLADAGASVLEVAHFLGHSYDDTALVYFTFSKAQADRVNKALALSPTYSRVAEAIRTRVISTRVLQGRSSDHQVGGMPHGHPISGIGACNLGQSQCALNPVTSCYSCRKFIPVNDIDLHLSVQASLRETARFFYDETIGDRQSRSFVQLRLTIEQVSKVIADIESENVEIQNE